MKWLKIGANTCGCLSFLSEFLFFRAFSPTTEAPVWRWKVRSVLLSPLTSASANSCQLSPATSQRLSRWLPTSGWGSAGWQPTSWYANLTHFTHFYFVLSPHLENTVHSGGTPIICPTKRVHTYYVSQYFIYSLQEVRMFFTVTPFASPVTSEIQKRCFRWCLALS